MKIGAVDPWASADTPPLTPRSQWLGEWNPTTPKTPSNSDGGLECWRMRDPILSVYGHQWWDARL